MKLAEDYGQLPMGGSSFYATIIAYEDVTSLDDVQLKKYGETISDKYAVHPAPYEIVKYHCSQRGKWFNSYSEARNNE